MFRVLVSVSAVGCKQYCVYANSEECKLKICWLKPRQNKFAKACLKAGPRPPERGWLTTADLMVLGRLVRCFPITVSLLTPIPIDTRVQTHTHRGKHKACPSNSPQTGNAVSHLNWTALIWWPHDSAQLPTTQLLNSAKDKMEWPTDPGDCLTPDGSDNESLSLIAWPDGAAMSLIYLLYVLSSLSLWHRQSSQPATMPELGVCVCVCGLGFKKSLR